MRRVVVIVTSKKKKVVRIFNVVSDQNFHP